MRSLPQRTRCVTDLEALSHPVDRRDRTASTMAAEQASVDAAWTGDPQRSRMTPSSDDGALREFSGARTIGAVTRWICYGSLPIGALLVSASCELTTSASYAMLGLACVGLAMIVRWYGAPWRIRMGLDGFVIDPDITGKLVSWSEVDSVRIVQFEEGRSTHGHSFELAHLNVVWASIRQSFVPIWSSSPEEVQAIRATIEGRAAKAKSFVPSESLSMIHRGAMTVRAWRDALERSKNAHFRQTPIDTAALLRAIESGALARSSIVECAVAISVLGSVEERGALASLANRLVDERTAEAVRAAARGALDDPSIDQTTR